MIELEILSRGLEPINRTRLRYAAKVDNRMMDRYLNKLLKDGSLTKKKGFYKITQRGLKKAMNILRGYRNLYDLVQAQTCREMRR